MCACAPTCHLQCAVQNRQEAEYLLGNSVVFKGENTVVRSPSNRKSGTSTNTFVNLYRVVAHLGL